MTLNEPAIKYHKITWHKLLSTTVMWNHYSLIYESLIQFWDTSGFSTLFALYTGENKLASCGEIICHEYFIMTDTNFLGKRNWKLGVIKQITLWGLCLLKDICWDNKISVMSSFTSDKVPFYCFTNWPSKLLTVINSSVNYIVRQIDSWDESKT